MRCLLFIDHHLKLNKPKIRGEGKVCAKVKMKGGQFSEFGKKTGIFGDLPCEVQMLAGRPGIEMMSYNDEM
jgi:hypothetical protein